MIGGIDLGTSCLTDSTVSIHGNEDQRHLPLSTSIYPAFKYTDLNWYLSKTGSAWNYRNPAFPTPFIFHTTGSLDDPTYQGDNLQPALDASKRGAMYYRPSAGHPAGGMFVHWDWLRNFRKNRSFLAFVNRSYDDFQNYSGNGYMNDLTKHGWDPETIVDDTGHYRVTLTGTGTADVTLRNLQKLQHSPGTVFNVTINGANSGQVTADEFGLITIPHVRSPATINLINPILVSIRHQNPAGSNVLNKAKLGNQIEEFTVNGKRMTTSQKRGLGVYIRQTNTTKTGQRLTINIR